MISIISYLCLLSYVIFSFHNGPLSFLIKNFKNYFSSSMTGVRYCYDISKSQATRVECNQPAGFRDSALQWCLARTHSPGLWVTGFQLSMVRNGTTVDEERNGDLFMIFS